MDGSPGSLSSTAQMTQRFKDWIQESLFFGNRPSLELSAILLVYLVQGIIGLARLAVSFFLKDELGLGPAQVSALVGIAAIPWMIKPLFGFISDGVPLFGYHRRPYLIASGLLGTATWVALGTVVHSAWAATLAIALSSLSVAFSDVIVDSVVVERARGESHGTAGSLQALCWGVSAFGGLLTAYLSGVLLEKVSVQTVFLMTAVFPLLVAAIAGLIHEEGGGTAPGLETVKTQIRLLKEAIAQKRIWLPTLFLFLWQSTPSSDSAFFFFTTNELGFTPEFLGRVQLVTNLAALVGIWVFQRFFKTIPFRSIFGWTILISTLLGFSSLLLVTHANRSLGIDDHWFSLGDSLILTVAGQIAFMPVLVLAARLCPLGIEATLFALLMSIVNFGGLAANELGAVLTHWLGVTETNFEQMWLLVLLTNLSNLLPLPLLGMLPDASAQMEMDGEHGPLPPVEVGQVGATVLEKAIAAPLDS